ncbi:I78 family peptidase inhibitor [Halomonas sabkhae]|uniref:I78 family peptidase inhibitor n=1 Tax=Halomonas sabkhae TaxID=626223 RepID=UPI0025B4C4D8|nr:I78 family peptidase inhibitor [Halomonas sabkhae]MDN3525303.1 I78 family peptidase inhibitor [Halomonas sabkhae]
MRYRILSFVAAGLILTGCAGQSSPTASPERDKAPEPPTMSQSDDLCGAEQVHRYVGTSYTETLGDTLEQESGAGTIRVKRPGMAYTLEYRADRLDVSVNEENVIQTIQCG